jgi:cytoskeletal protein RodZ
MEEVTMDTSRLVRVGNNRYLDPNDPLFLDKIMQEFPHLKPEVAEQYMRDALAEHARTEPVPKAKQDADVKAIKSKNREGYFYACLKVALVVLLFIVLLVLLCLFVVKYEEQRKLASNGYTETSHQVVSSLLQTKNGTLSKTASEWGNVKSTASKTSESILPLSAITDWISENIGSPLTKVANATAPKGLNVDEAALKTAVMRSAVENYHIKTGTYPSIAPVLSGESTDNWLSFIPSDMNYALDNGKYRVYPNGFDPNCVCKPSTIELAFYPEANQLALMQGNTVLSVYPVASAKPGSELPFTESAVTKRVVNPNGGNGAYGKRALALDDNYAIHGTNNEESIGQRVSHGCLRMKEKDIEELYPYVSLGTPFKVKQGAPDSPMYPKGLPDLGGAVNVPAESTPNVVYTWHS